MSKFSRVKTDKADSELIAKFCQAMQPELWQPTPKHIQELQQWVRRLNTLIANKNQENNYENEDQQQMEIEDREMNAEMNDHEEENPVEDEEEEEQN